MSTTSNGYSNVWECANCHTFVPVGQYHTCSPAPVYWIDPWVLERIAKALETIASQLAEKRNET